MNFLREYLSGRFDEPGALDAEAERDIAERRRARCVVCGEEVPSANVSDSRFFEALPDEDFDNWFCEEHR